jgi:hypothetical protein
MMSGRLLEQLVFVEGLVPVDLNGGVNTGAYVSIAEYKRIVVVLVKAVGTVSDTVTLTVQQSKDVLGTGVKALNFTTYYTKEIAVSLVTSDLWTKNTQASANTITNTNAVKDQMWAVEFAAEELDFANGFKVVNALVNQPGHTALGYLFYLLGEARFPGAPEKMLTAIT